MGTDMQLLRAALTNRIKTLQAERLKIDMKIEVLQEILSGKDVPLEALANASHRTSTMVAPTNGSGGLRAKLYSILAASGPLTRKQAIARVEETGFRPSGKTPIKILVTSELYRLTRAGQLSKSPDGQFSVARRT